MKPKFLFLLLLASAAYVAVLISGTKAEERSKANQAKLEAAFKALPSFPRATRVGDTIGLKSGHGLVGATYSTSATSSEIRAYYDSVLLARGWHFAREEPLRDWGRGLGGYIVHYTKDDFTASLQYAGQRTNYGWDYAFELSWGLH